MTAFFVGIALVGTGAGLAAAFYAGRIQRIGAITERLRACLDAQERQQQEWQKDTLALLQRCERALGVRE